MAERLTAKKFDQVTTKTVPRPRVIWTLDAIADWLGCGKDFVRDVIAPAKGSPVREMGGRYYALEDELLKFMRRRKQATKNHAGQRGTTFDR